MRPQRYGFFDAATVLASRANGGAASAPPESAFL